MGLKKNGMKGYIGHLCMERATLSEYKETLTARRWNYLERAIYVIMDVCIWIPLRVLELYAASFFLVALLFSIPLTFRVFYKTMGLCCTWAYLGTTPTGVPHPAILGWITHAFVTGFQDICPWYNTTTTTADISLLRSLNLM